MALRNTFGEAADEIVVCNTKGFTGHPMGAGVEDVIAVKILEYGIVPPVPNYKEVDPDLGVLNLSRGGRYPVQYALHLAAGFGSQIAMTLIRRIPGGHDRVDNKAALSALAGRRQRLRHGRDRSRQARAAHRGAGPARCARRLPAPGSMAPARWCAPRRRATAWQTDYRPLPMPAVAAAVRGEGRGATVASGRAPEREMPRPATAAPAPAPAPTIAEPVAPARLRLHQRPPHRPRQQPASVPAAPIARSPVSDLQSPDLQPSTRSSSRCWASSPTRPAIRRTCSTSTWTWKPTWASTR